MKKFSTKNKLRLIYPYIVFTLVWIVAASLINNNVILPSVKETIGSLLSNIKSEGFFLTVLSSVYRAVIAFFLSLLISIVLAISSVKSKMLKPLIDSLIGFMSSVPVIAIILLALIWLKAPHVPIFVALMVLVPIMYETVESSIFGIDKNIIEMVSVYEISYKSLLLYIYIPSILHGLSGISGTSLSTAFKMVIAGEVLSQPAHSIGASLQLDKMYLNTSGLFAWILIILVISKLLRLSMDSLKIKLWNRKWM